MLFVVFFFKQKTAYEMRISDWSSDVCSSDLRPVLHRRAPSAPVRRARDLSDGSAGKFFPIRSLSNCISRQEGLPGPHRPDRVRRYGADMAGKQPGGRPPTPHLGVYKWAPSMAVSIDRKSKRLHSSH